MAESYFPWKTLPLARLKRGRCPIYRSRPPCGGAPSAPSGVGPHKLGLPSAIACVTSRPDLRAGRREELSIRKLVYVIIRIKLHRNCAILPAFCRKLISSSDPPPPQIPSPLLPGKSLRGCQNASCPGEWRKRQIKGMGGQNPVGCNLGKGDRLTTNRSRMQSLVQPEKN